MEVERRCRRKVPSAEKEEKKSCSKNTSRGRRTQPPRKKRTRTRHQNPTTESKSDCDFIARVPQAIRQTLPYHTLSETVSVAAGPCLLQT